MSNFLKYFEIKQEYRKIKPFKCVLKEGINLIVGENGSGKSSILDLFTTQDATKRKNIISFEHAYPEKEISFRFLDSEKHNPRLKDFQNPSTFQFTLMSHFISHGETMLPFVRACAKMKDTLLFIDEPEAGISIRNQSKLLEAFLQAEKNGCQLIISTHSYILIKETKEVFCLDNYQWMSSQDYLKKVLRTNKNVNTGTN